MTPLRELIERRSGPLVMGVVNRTPDSFSDGGAMLDDGAALAAVDAMIAAGATIVDIGAESTRPGAAPISAEEQIARLGGVVRAIADKGVAVSIDTTSTAVAERALGDGASGVNSVALEAAAPLAALAGRASASLVLMHCRGAMKDMRGFSTYPEEAYGDVVADVAREWWDAASRALEVMPREDLVMDPGLGFAKSARHSLELTARLDELVALGFPVLAGPSRKSFLARAVAGDAKDLPGPRERLGATIAACLACARAGAAILRVHDVAPVAQALAFDRALRRCAPRVPSARRAVPRYRPARRARGSGSCLRRSRA